MEKISLQAEIRDTAEKLAHIRSNKMLPAVVYWHKEDSLALTLNYADFLKTFRKTWASHIINLKVGKKDLEVLVHEVQKEPVSGDFLHIDFYAITRWEVLTTKIHLNFTWVSQAVKEWGILNEIHKEIEVKCKPGDLVDAFDVDLTLLKEIGDSIRVSDLVIDTKKYTILTHAEEIVVQAGAPAKIEVLEPIEVPEVTGADKEENEEKED